MHNRVKKFLEELGLTQKELGKRVLVSRQAINALETENLTHLFGSHMIWQNCLVCQ